MGRGASENSNPVVVSTRTGKTRSWDDTRIENELRQLSRPLGRFPTWAEIEEHSSSLNCYLRERGRAYWAKKLGYRPRRQGEQLPERIIEMTKWTDQAIEEELRRLHQHRDTMLLSDQLPAGFRNVVGKKGIAYWSEKIGVKRSGPQRWGDTRIEEELEDYLQGREFFPTQKDFAYDGKTSLHSAMRRHHGVAYWRKRSGLPLAKAGPKRGETMQQWDDLKIKHELNKVLQGRRFFPSRDEFTKMGLSKLRAAMERHHGVEYWRRQSGLSFVPSQVQRQSMNSSSNSI